MTVWVTFAMGAKEAYFFNSPTHWAWRNLPPEVETLFTQQPPIKDVLDLALGENGTYFISYRDQSGQIQCRHYNLPNPLVTYLYQSHSQVVRDLSTLSITLGPYESYYAHDRTSASWGNLPSALEKAILHRLVSQDDMRTVWKENGAEAPSFVSLGADGSYFMRTVRGGGSWDLKSKAEGMMGTNKFLEGARDFSNIAGVYLFPKHPDCYVLLLMTGKAFANLPDHTWDDYSKMAPALPLLKQLSLPIPAVPQPKAQSPPQTAQQPVFQPQVQQNPAGSYVRVQQTQFVPHNCCPPAATAAHNCCPPPVQTVQNSCCVQVPQVPSYARRQHTAYSSNSNSTVWPNTSSSNTHSSSGFGNSSSGTMADSASSWSSAFS